ncbi:MULTISPECIES: methyl-accepting chemotaxis protein [Escherichia]|uniref:methyl-accepting chemotaxis protein n=1 Tax=Escherichia TaxID=561 RepID=UPI00287FBEF3|nr:methyl-accepting chemotaxis protein [Escherichia coli]
MLILLGYLVVLGTVFGGYLMTGGSLGALYQPAELVIIAGAGIGSFIVGNNGKAITMTHTMQEIATSSQKIGDIISVIDGIAFQTNILALNAAVEAARAGEQGRGFAVVAGEVRNLASRSAQAAKEIKGLIEESVNRVQQGSKLVNNAAATMIDIVSSVTRVNDIMGEIASASEEQQRGIEQVAQAVSQMDQVTQQNASLVEEAAVATEQLANQADHLSSRVAVFTLEEHEVARHESVQLQIAPVVS